MTQLFCRLMCHQCKCPICRKVRNIPLWKSKGKRRRFTKWSKFITSQHFFRCFTFHRLQIITQTACTVWAAVSSPLTFTALGCFIVVTGCFDLVSPAMSLSHMRRRPSAEPLASQSSPGDHWRLQIPPVWAAAPTRGAGARGSRWWIRPSTEPLFDCGRRY